MWFTLDELFLLLISTFTTTAVFNLALYFGYHKKLDYLFFAFYCGFHVFKAWLKTFPAEEVLLPLFGLTAFDLIYLSVILGLLSLNVFLLYHFEFPHKRRFIVAGILVGVSSFLLLPEGVFIYLGIATALGQTITKYRTHRSEWSYLIGVLMLLVLSTLGFTNALPFGYFIGTLVMILFMVIATGQKLALQTRALNEATLKSSRLENQLLKKSIQPHFVLNAMTSLQELIEQHPHKASSFVEDLSQVFAVFAKVSEQQLIKIEDELRLVSSFLKVMSVRLDKEFRLTTAGLEADRQIPPGILLTLVENGVTHGFERLSEGAFVITLTEKGNGTILTIENNGEPPAKIKEGVGLNYVRSRLEEAFGGNFDLQYERLANGFRTKIHFPGT